MYDVNDQCRTPDPKQFFSESENKASLLDYVCEKWVNDEIVNPELVGDTKLFIGGGFKDATRSVMLSNGSVSSVPEL